jgi:hypothetical protein
MGLFKKARNKISSAVSSATSAVTTAVKNTASSVSNAVSNASQTVASGVRNASSNIRDRANSIRDRVSESKFVDKLRGVGDNIRDFAEDRVEDVRGRFDDFRGDIRDFLSSDVRDKMAEIIKLQNPEPVDLTDPTAVIRDTEEKITTRILGAADDVVDQNQENLLNMLDRVELTVLKEIDEWSPSAAEQLKKDFLVARGVLVNVMELVDAMINEPEEIERRDFVRLLQENTRALSSTSEYVLSKVREQIPRDSLLQDLFDLIEETNREQGLTKTKFVFMMGANPEEEEEKRAEFMEELIDDIEELEDELQDELAKRPQDRERINEIKAEIKTKQQTAQRLNRPFALDLYSDIFQDVDPQLERLVGAILNDGETDLVDPPLISIETEQPRKRIIDFTFNQPDPELDPQKEVRIEGKMKKRLDAFAKLIERLDPEPTPKPKTRQEILLEQKLPEKQMIQRILNRTRLDEMLKVEFIKQENEKKGGVAFTKDTRDKMRISKIEDDMSDVDSENRIMDNLRKNTPTYLDLMRQHEEESKKEAAKGKPINTNINRNEKGFILSDETVEEGKLAIELIDKAMLRTTTVENLIDIDFKDIKLPAVQEDTVKRLEGRIKQLEEEITDLNSDKDSLQSTRIEQREKIDAKEEQLEQLQQQLVEVQDRLSITPAEGTVFSIPIVETSHGTTGGHYNQKYNIDYWVIENGERRRLINYACAQFYLSQRKKSLMEIAVIEPETIRRIPQGADIAIAEITPHGWAKQGLERNCYIPDDVLDSGKFRVIWGTVQEEVADDLTYHDIITWMSYFAIKGDANKQAYESNGRKQEDSMKGAKQYRYDGRKGRILEGVQHKNLHAVDPKLLSFNIWYGWEVGIARTVLAEQAMYTRSRHLNNKYNAYYRSAAEDKKIVAAEKAEAARIAAEKKRREDEAKRRADEARRRAEALARQRRAHYEQWMRAGEYEYQLGSQDIKGNPINTVDTVNHFNKAAVYFANALRVPGYARDKKAALRLAATKAMSAKVAKVKAAQVKYNELIRVADFAYKKLNPTPKLDPRPTPPRSLRVEARLQYAKDLSAWTVKAANFGKDAVIWTKSWTSANLNYRLAAALEGYMNTSYAKNQLESLRSMQSKYATIFKAAKT